MYQYSTKAIVKEYENTDGNQVSEFFPLIINDRLQTIFQSYKEPSPKDYEDAAIKINNIVGTSFEAGHVQTILSFYPYVKTKIAHYSLQEETMASMLLDVVSDFLLDCRWPDYSDALKEEEHSKYFEAFSMQAEAFIKGFEMMMEMKLIANPSSEKDNDAEAYYACQTEVEDKIVLSKSTLKELSEYFEYLCEIKLTDTEIEDVLNSSPSLKARIFRFGLHDTDIGVEIEEAFTCYYFGDDEDECKTIDENKKAVLEKRKSLLLTTSGSDTEDQQDSVYISDKTYNEISLDLKYYTGVLLSREEINEVLDYRDIKPDIVKWGVSDTVVRDNILESLFIHYLNENFNGEEEQKNRLTKEIQERRKKG